jgi:hypothetical protein
MRPVPVSTVLGVALVALACVAAMAPGARADEAPAQAPTAVRVQRVKPDHPKLATLRFFGANRDYLRAELDRLRTNAVRVKGDATAIDPRFLAYGEMIAAANAAGDSAASADSARSGRELFASVTELGGLESELDQMDRAMARQRDRLGVLQRDFAGEQRTALAVVLSGWPGDAAPPSLVISLDDGTQQTVSLTPEQRDALRAGGAVQVMHRLVEPREQVIGVTLAGAPAPGWLEFEPVRDRLNLLRLDLSRLVSNDAADLAATTWILDDRTP